MRYTKTHEWIKAVGDKGTVGISSHAQQELGEIVYIELPKVGQRVAAGAEVAVLESTKAAADIYSPASGTIVAVNKELEQDPDLMNRDPEGRGYLFEIAIESPEELAELTSPKEYRAWTLQGAS